MTQVYFCLSVPEEHWSPTPRELLPKLILRGTLAAQTKRGRNTILCATQNFQADTLFIQDAADAWQERSVGALPFDFTVFTAEQRQQREASYPRLAEASGLPLEQVDILYPFVLLLPGTHEVTLYHQLAIGRRGALFVAYDRQPLPDDPLGAAEIVQLITASWQTWEVARCSFNQSCWYSKWRPDVEMERKYTFAEPLDTWAHIQKMYCLIRDGALPGFMPEFNDEFQIWDFDNYLFEVFEPAEPGYISFIPQSDGLMTVKRKRFRQDSEIRQEQLTARVDLTLDQIAAYAHEQTGGALHALPPFRRKRFDINLESLETGNVYGIFLDICRPFGAKEHALYQCEVEYLRSRVMGPFVAVMEEYEQVCAFTHAYLSAAQLPFSEGYYSKLSFLRDYVAALQQNERKA